MNTFGYQETARSGERFGCLPTRSVAHHSMRSFSKSSQNIWRALSDANSGVIEIYDDVVIQGTLQMGEDWLQGSKL